MSLKSKYYIAILRVSRILKPWAILKISNIISQLQMLEDFEVLYYPERFMSYNLKILENFWGIRRFQTFHCSIICRFNASYSTQSEIVRSILGSRLYLEASRSWSFLSYIKDFESLIYLKALRIYASQIARTLIWSTWNFREAKSLMLLYLITWKLWALN